MFRSILVTTDLTHRCDARVASAAALAQATGARLHAVYVPHGEAHGRGERRLARQLARVVPATVRVASQRVMACAPENAIAEAAGRVGADLIVLGPAGAATWADRLFGTTGDRVLRALDVPVLVVREALTLPLRRAAVALGADGTGRGPAEHALRWGAALGPPRFHHTPVEVRVSRVLAPGTRDTQRPGAAAVTEAEDGVLLSEEVRWAESAVDEISRMVERDRPDLLVMEADARRTLAGSVWARVARISAVPVLVVPRPAPAAAPRAAPRTLGRPVHA
jgi:nucleotide-binding universal stress UspA family protein